MNSLFRHHPTAAALLLSLAIACAAGSAQAGKYVVTDLGTLGGSQAFPHGINASGQVVGDAYLSGDSAEHGFRTKPNQPINPATDDVGTLGGTWSAAYSINNRGQVAGIAALANGTVEPYRLDATGTLQDLGSLFGLPNSVANGINNLGQVTGASWVNGGAYCYFVGGSHAYLTAANSPLNPSDDLGTAIPGNCRYSDGFAVNDAGHVVGYTAASNFASPQQHAMYWTPNGGLQDLGVLGITPGVPNNLIDATAVAINASDWIVGRSTYNHDPAISAYATHAFFSIAGGPMTDMGTLGGNWSEASGINSAGAIVGDATLAGDSASHAFLYANGTMQDLNNALPAGSNWVLVSAEGINDSGQIIATGWLNGVAFVGHAVRLDPSDVADYILMSELSDPSLGLTSGQIASLTDKLTNALASIQAGLNKQAVNQLNAFVNAVQVMLKTGKISANTASILTSAANAIIATLS
ncbi:MAG: hypothetical protein OJF55_001499 [Rhodanobacteraceae bacterium]|jgi:probable HAF family extracellular repeat protein|nr:MAG: hypothetical protein OJF55_001499 [Rhodanobacteraceae bacterium]